MKEIRALAEKDPDVRSEVIHCVEGVKNLLNSVFAKLSLKGKYFISFEAASELQLDVLFSKINKIDPLLTKDKTKAKEMEKQPNILDFLKSHCVQRNYMFSVKKCGKITVIFVVIQCYPLMFSLN